MDRKGHQPMRLRHAFVQRCIRRSNIPYSHFPIHTAISALFLSHESAFRPSSSPSSQQLPLSAPLQMHTLNPGMMFPPCPHHNDRGVLHPLVKETDHTIPKAGHKDVTLRLVRCQRGQICSGLSSNVL